ncbi:piggyBac transposable element-derived protein 4-like [Homalodisca vitripennis]|uniref:piggyBac transposable element-derived protein 4-like n=1 Tax=Homalodisca vitripennis TaxID=197043 RepID=UPI001EEA4C28|nr:piggyBac transposable element-derived protein 4-like [Homalodisca vitripennis]
MKAIYEPGRELCIDESMVLWRGRLIFRQYIKNKRHKYGLNLYVLTEPNGLVINFAVYAGVNDFDLGGVGHSKTVVLHLIQDRLDLGHAVYMDNYYNSFDLSKELLDRKTYTTGTLRAKRKNTPSEVVETKLARGEVTCYYADGVAIGKWHDKRDVRFISTEHVLDMEECKNKQGETTMKPTAIVEYNKYMKGVDRQDQMLAYYPVTRKTTRWYKKLGIHIIEMMVVNSYMMFKSHSGLQRLSRMTIACVWLNDYYHLIMSLQIEE